MASLAKQAVGDNDPVSAEMYEKQANLYWLKHHAIVMEDPPHKRPILPAFPYPHRQPGPPLGIQRDPKLPAWGSKQSQQHQCQLRSRHLRTSSQHSPRGSTLCNRPMCSPSQCKRSQHRPST
ncbi:hypothetical protein WJX77_005594 [Trebouxia sp. C0004]